MSNLDHPLLVSLLRPSNGRALRARCSRERRGTCGSSAATTTIVAVASDRGPHLPEREHQRGLRWLFKLLCEARRPCARTFTLVSAVRLLATLEDVGVDSYPLTPARRFRIDLAGIEAAISNRTRAIVLVHPNNPTGSFIRRDEARAIEVYRRAPGLALIVDEVSATSHWRGPRGSAAELRGPVRGAHVRTERALQGRSAAPAQARVDRRLRPVGARRGSHR